MSADPADWLQRAAALHARGELEAAAALYAQVLAVYPGNADALHLLGVIDVQSGNPAAGLQRITAALALRPGDAAALANRANALLALGRHADALQDYEQSLLEWPDYALAHLGRGNALQALGRTEEALPSLTQAVALSPGLLPARQALARVLLRLQRFAAALQSFDAAIVLAPQLPQLHLGRAAALQGLGDATDAAASIAHALALAPDLADAYTARGELRSAQGEVTAALRDFDRSLAIDPGNATTWRARGFLLALQGRNADAADSFARALAIDPALPFARGAALHAQLQVCAWHDYPAATMAVCGAIERGAAADFPFSFLAVRDSLHLQRRCAATFAALSGTTPSPLYSGSRYRHERIRVAYISGDFLEHPTSYLIAGLFEHHDRSRFETIGISLRDDPASPLRARISAALERFIVPGRCADAVLAQLIRDLEVDIVVDLMGFTGEHRAGVFAFRPAPIQVNYLGFPGTTAMAAMDYIIADEFLVPAASRQAYGECVVHLPGCFQVNDDRRPMPLVRPARAQAGLPAAAFVWCSFHGSYKLNPPLFDVWMRLVLATPGSVLWILGSNPLIRENLKREAGARGVDVGRLVFADSLAYADHLARLPLADLCLDTLPFNGGATTSDALWAGVPLVTCAGESFAARMSGSLLTALGLPQLIATSLEDYERLALQLAADPGRLASIRAQLATAECRSRVFDTARFTRGIESAFAMMQARHDQGLPPAHLSATNLAPAARPR